MPRIQMNQKIAVGAVFVAAMFMNIMDVTIVNVALPTIGREFHVRPDRSTRSRSPTWSAWRCSYLPPGGWATASEAGGCC